MLLQPQIVGSGASAGGALKSERKMKSAKKSIRGLVESVGVGICTLPFFSVDIVDVSLSRSSERDVKRHSSD